MESKNRMHVTKGVNGIHESLNELLSARTFRRSLVAVAITVPMVFLLTLAVTEASYSYRQRGNNRMEGLKEVLSASLDMRIVSFLSYRENMQLSQGDSLSIKFYVWSDEPVFITAREILPVHHYFMKPIRTNWTIGWQLFTPWEASEVLVPKQIYPHGLGIVGRVTEDKDGSGQIVPIIFYLKEPPARVTSYSMVLLSRETLSKIRYTLSRTGASQPIVHRVLRKEFPANGPILLKLDLSMKPAGLYELSIHGKIKNENGGPTRTYQFFHQPDINQN